MNMNFAIAEELESNAEWRHGKAIEYPHDKRNEEAADASEELATLFRNDDADPDILGEYAEMFDDDNPSVDPYVAQESLGIILKGIGFGAHYADAEDFMIAVLRQAKGPAANR